MFAILSSEISFYICGIVLMLPIDHFFHEWEGKFCVSKDLDITRVLVIIKNEIGDIWGSRIKQIFFVPCLSFLVLFKKSFRPYQKSKIFCSFCLFFENLRYFEKHVCIFAIFLCLFSHEYFQMSMIWRQLVAFLLEHEYSHFSMKEF